MPEVTALAEDVPLADYTTLRLGGRARRLVTARDTTEVIAAVRAATRAGEPVLVLAGGSNVVIGDAGFPGTVVLLRSAGWSVAESGEFVELTVDAGTTWDHVVATAVDAGWAGIECLSGIPGSAGATPIQNVGAYGQEVADTISEVRAYDRLTDTVVSFSGPECGFGYRTSVFRHTSRWVVLAVRFRLVRSTRSLPVRYAQLASALDVPMNGTVPLAEVRAAVLALRATKGMVLDPNDLDTCSAGSFFTNPVLGSSEYAALVARVGAEPPSWPAPGGAVKVSAAWLIERAGFAKGYPVGGPVGISTKHTLALTNRGGGKTVELLALAREIRDGVRERFGVTLHPEPVLINCSL